MTDKAKYFDENVPIVFAEAIANVSTNGQVVKLYVGRFDPSHDGTNESRFVPSAQIVLSLDGFLNLNAFMQLSLDNMKRDGTVTDEKLNEAKQRVQPIE